MNNYRSSVNKYIRFISFFLGLAVILMCINHVLTEKTAKKTMYSLRYEPKNTIDVVFLGNSHANQAFLPMELWNDYGYTAYSMTMMSQTFPLVYYSAVDAIKLQQPEILVVDLFAATSFSNNFDNMHKTVDNLTFSTRMKVIREFVPEEKKTEYRFPLYLYHDRWDELEIKDFIPYFIRYTPMQNARKGATLASDHALCKVPERAIEVAYDSEYVELPEEALYWYNRLKELCQNTDTQLLFTVVPYETPVESTEDATVDNMKLFNATERWCAENDVDYLNMFRNIDEMDFDFERDLADVSHLNILGAEKVTKLVGSYLFSNYDLADQRADETLSEKWDAYYQRYCEERDQAIYACGGVQQ